MELLLIKKEWCVSVTMGAIKLRNSPMRGWFFDYKLTCHSFSPYGLCFDGNDNLLCTTDMQNSVVAAKSASILVVYAVHNQNLTRATIEYTRST